MLEHIETSINRIKSRSTVLLVLLASIINLTACGSSDGDDEFKEAVKLNDLKITSITISSPNTITPPYIIAVDAEEKFTAMAEIDSGASADLDISDLVTWSSSDSSVISVDLSGSATAIADGTVEIRAALADLSGTQELSASSAELTSIAISIENDLASIGVCTSDQKFTAEGTFEDGRVNDVTTNITWKSSVESVVEIDNDQGAEGVVSALTVGDTVISAEHEDGVISNEVPLEVVDTLDSVTVTPDTITISTGATQQFTAIGSYSNLDDQDITTTAIWASDNTANLTVSNDDNTEGLATAVAVGDADVTVSCGDNSDTAAVTIEAPVTITAVEINNGRDTESGEVGDSNIDLLAEIQYSDSTELDVTDDSNTTWSIESGTSVSVSDAGVVTILAVGNTTIKVVYDDDVVSISDTIDIDIN